MPLLQSIQLTIFLCLIRSFSNSNYTPYYNLRLPTRTNPSKNIFNNLHSYSLITITSYSMLYLFSLWTSNYIISLNQLTPEHKSNSHLTHINDSISSKTTTILCSPLTAKGSCRSTGSRLNSTGRNSLKTWRIWTNPYNPTFPRKY